MKNILIIIILLASVKCFGQDYHVLTLIAKSFTIDNNGKSTKVNRAISLTYNTEHSLLYIQGEGTFSFPNINYSQTIQEGGWFMESYVSGETETTEFGHWGVMVNKMKEGNVFEIIFRNGITYIAEHAQLYSENGTVNNNPYVKNWKELLEKEKLQNSLAKQRDDFTKDSIAKDKIKDSLELIKLDSLKQVEIENKLQSGNNYNALGRSVEYSLNSIVQKNVKLKKNEVIYSSWIIKIDKDGVITDAHPDEKYKGGHIINLHIPAINNALINQRVKPFVANGKKYPSYSDVYINLQSFILK